MKEKIKTILTQLNVGLVEREEALKAALLTVLAGENLVLIGPPGTGKSMIARRLAESIDSSDAGGNDYFEYLLTKFSTPEEIFGPLSITELKADRFKRNTAGYLPTVHIAFLDEIFKASSSILNALLTILNERIYHNGTERQKVPLKALISASNELPADQEELSALYDRFLVRIFVDYINQDNLFHLFENNNNELILTNKLTEADLYNIQESAKSVVISQEISEVIQQIWLEHKQLFKEDRRESLSDRRLKKVIQLLRISAITNGRKEVDLSDIFLLKNCLWNHQDNAIKVRNLILNILNRFSYPIEWDETENGIFLENNNKETPIESSVTSDKVKNQQDVKIKGYKGGGTKNNPLLISCVEDLMDLSRPDVGYKGYYFKQTCDIDCSVISSWMTINFDGSYDGGGFSITSNTYRVLFNQVNDSIITNINLIGLSLAQTISNTDMDYSQLDNSFVTGEATNCKFKYCKSGGQLIRGIAKTCEIIDCESSSSLISGGASDCTISYCQSGENLINYKAENCTITGCIAHNNLLYSNKEVDIKNCVITQCQSGDSLITFDSLHTWSIRVSTINCKIRDCLILLNPKNNKNNNYGVTKDLQEKSIVERCFVMGSPADDFCGITLSISQECIIKQCAIGKLDKININARIIKCVSHGKIELPLKNQLENNASIDTNRGENDPNGKDGATVPAAIFNTQRYFENTLGWDFDNVWIWDEDNQQPKLRHVGPRLNGNNTAKNIPIPIANTADLLTLQIKNNIWI